MLSYLPVSTSQPRSVKQFVPSLCFILFLASMLTFMVFIPPFLQTLTFPGCVLAPSQPLPNFLALFVPFHTLTRVYFSAFTSSQCPAILFFESFCLLSLIFPFLPGFCLSMSLIFFPHFLTSSLQHTSLLSSDRLTMLLWLMLGGCLLQT